MAFIKSRVGFLWPVTLVSLFVLASLFPLTISKKLEPSKTLTTRRPRQNRYLEGVGSKSFHHNLRLINALVDEETLVELEEQLHKQIKHQGGIYKSEHHLDEPSLVKRTFFHWEFMVCAKEIIWNLLNHKRLVNLKRCCKLINCKKTTNRTTTTTTTTLPPVQESITGEDELEEDVTTTTSTTMPPTPVMPINISATTTTPTTTRPTTTILLMNTLGTTATTTKPALKNSTSTTTTTIKPSTTPIMPTNKPDTVSSTNTTGTESRPTNHPEVQVKDEETEYYDDGFDEVTEMPANKTVEIVQKVA